ncbi:golgin subfamily A member 6-like protein 7 [Littorina saxatilis]
MEIKSLKEQNTTTKKRMKDLHDEVNEANTQQMYAENSSLGELPKTEETAYENAQLKEEIREMNLEQGRLTSHNASLQEEIRKLRKQVESLAYQQEDKSKETEEVRQQEHEYADRFRTLEREVEGYRKANERLKSENQHLYRQMEDSRKRNIVLEERTGSMEKELLQLKLHGSALQASSATRETSLTESHQQYLAQLREQHKSDLKEMERRSTAEKEELQSQLELFLRSLNDDKRLERDTVRTAVQQMAQTNMVTNQILNAAFRAYQERRYGPSASVREMEDDF